MDKDQSSRRAAPNLASYFYCIAVGLAIGWFLATMANRITDFWWSVFGA